MTDTPQPLPEVAGELLIILAGAIVDLKEAVRQLGGDKRDVARSIQEVDEQIAQVVEAFDVGRVENEKKGQPPALEPATAPNSVSRYACSARTGERISRF